MVQKATTPVLTPTTLKCLAQLFESSEEDNFAVPEVPKAKVVFQNTRSWQGGNITVVTPTKSESLPSFEVMETVKTLKKPARKAVRSRPGVKGKTNPDEAGLSPEEAERLRIRRERNKAAAARCRKRRMDQISVLSEEVDQHEAKQRILENQIAELKSQKAELEAILAQHQQECRFLVQEQPKRPLTLDIGQKPTVQGVDIETPSTILGSITFESLMASSGLTPIMAPTMISFNTTCSVQQRSELSATTPNSEFTTLISL